MIASRALRAASSAAALAAAAFALHGAAAAETRAPYALGDRVEARGLIAQSGRPFRFDDGTGRVVAFSFVYTACRDADGCPLTTARFVKLQRLVDPARVRLALVTIVPRADTPGVLRRYAAAFHADPARLTFVTGDARAVGTLAARFTITGTDRDPDGALDHAERLIVLDGAGRVADRIDGNLWLPEDAAAVTGAVAGLAHDPIRRIAVHVTWAVEHRCGLPDSGVAASLHHDAVALVMLLPPAPLAVLLLRERRRRRAPLARVRRR